MMVATNKLNVLRINWEGQEERDYSLDLRRIPFSINQQVRYGNYQCLHYRFTVNLIKTIDLIIYSRPHTGTGCLYYFNGLFTIVGRIFNCFK